MPNRFPWKLGFQDSAKGWPVRPPPPSQISKIWDFSLQGVGKYPAPLEIIVQSYKESITTQKLNQSVSKHLFLMLFENLCSGRIRHIVVFGEMLVFSIDFATNLLIMVCLNRSCGKMCQNGSEKSLLFSSFLITASWPALLPKGYGAGHLRVNLVFGGVLSNKR